MWHRHNCILLRWLLIFAFGVATAVPAFPHDVLTAEVAQEYLAAIARADDQVKGGKTEAARLDGLYELGTKAVLFANEINRELQAHGPNANYDLIALIQTRLERYGVSINKAGRGYAYNFAAFREYLRQAPRGKHAADSRLVLVLFVDSPDDCDRLENSANEKRLFLRDFPSHPSVPSVLFRLAKDEMKLSELALTLEAKSPASRAEAGKQAKISATEHLQEILRRFPNSDEAEDARRYLNSVH